MDPPKSYIQQMLVLQILWLAVNDEVSCMMHHSGDMLLYVEKVAGYCGSLVLEYVAIKHDWFITCHGFSSPDLRHQFQGLAVLVLIV